MYTTQSHTDKAIVCALEMGDNNFDPANGSICYFIFAHSTNNKKNTYMKNDEKTAILFVC